MIDLFTALSKEQKINFFLKCQELLVTYHPESTFIFREDNIESRKNFIMDFYNKYQGYCYQNDNVCVLFNKPFVENPNNIVNDLKNNLFKPPSEKPNSIFVDFVVFRQLQDIKEFYQSQYTENLKYIFYVKNNKIKFYKFQELLKKFAQLH